MSDDDERNERAPRTTDSPSALTSADPVRNFSLTVDERIRALTIGAPAWATRKRRIEDAEERLVTELVELHDELVAAGRRPDDVDRALLQTASKIDLARLNALVKSHNRYYPVEANLPMDPGGNYLVYGRVWRPEEPYTAARLVQLARERIRRRAAQAETDD